MYYHHILQNNQTQLFFRSDSISDDGSDDDFTEWHEMRTKLKERAKQEPKNLEKSSQTHTSKLSRKPFSPRKEKALGFSREILGATAERLSEEELTGGVPLGTSNIMSELNCPTTGDIQNLQEGNADVQGVIKESIQSVATLKADAGICSGSSGSGEHGQSDEWTSKEKIKDQGVGRTTVDDESFADMELNHEKEKAQNDLNRHVTHQVENYETTFPDSHKTTHATNICGPPDGGVNFLHAEAVTHSSYLDSPEDQHRSEKDVVESNGKESYIDVQKCKGDKGLDRSSSNAFAFKNKICIQLDERSASYDKKNEEKRHENITNAASVRAQPRPSCVPSDIKQGSGLKSTADIRISLRFSGTEEKKARSEMESQVRSLSTSGKDDKHQKTGQLSNSRVSKISSGNVEKYRYETKMKPSKTIPDQKTDTSVPIKADCVNKEEKTGIMNGQGICENHKIKNYMEEEKTMRSLISTDKTTTPNSRENKERNKNIMVHMTVKYCMTSTPCKVLPLM